ncbi:MAG: CCA tRNA nucleotidyltransferase [Deltaproteobacteria bacterium]|nr:CCA tRNA nucleotidyltransferase [Deltaproteobacteria bacterium]MBW1994785.1 CCA tRNA nucleotidyltransferase [Deltaproteobacteria bacterium]MBW2151452.1 CCA tRNA nucleotidyltransferase [Deltaproteobacteria bacterium]
MLAHSFIKLPRIDNAYIVGGAVRDLLLGEIPSDYDMVVLDDPQEAASRAARHLNGRLVKLGRSNELLFRIVTDEMKIDISRLKGNSIREDLQQRDFTINAMAYDISSAQIIDCHGGRQDLGNRIVRLVSKRAFRDDPIRLLRAYRLASALQFDIDPFTEEMIQKEAGLIPQAAPERIREEFFLMLKTPHACSYIRRMVTTGVLFGIFPELKKLQGCIQNGFHVDDVLDHTLKAFFHLESIINNPESIGPDLPRPVRRIAGKKKTVLLKCALLLHDIGKPYARTTDAGGRIHFYRHEQIGAEMVKTITLRLRFSTFETDFLEFMIRNHLRPLLLFQASENKKLTHRARVRFFMKAGENTPFLLLHAIADQKSKYKASNDSFLAFSLNMLNRFYKEYRIMRTKPPLITGHDLIKEFGLNPSPRFGKILRMVEEARLSRQITSKEEALGLVQNYLASTGY